MVYIFNSFGFQVITHLECVCLSVLYVVLETYRVVLYSFAPYYLMRTIGFRLEILEEENILIALTLLELCCAVAFLD